MIEAIGSGLTAVIGWVGEVVDALVTTEGALYPLLALFGIGVAISAAMFSVKVIKGMVWGS